MRAKATEWKFDGKTKDGNGVSHTQNTMVTEHSEAPDGSSTGLGLKEFSKEEMISHASPLRTFGSVAEEPVKDEFMAKASTWDPYNIAPASHHIG